MSHYIRKLPWPCSKVDRDVLHELWLEAQQTGRPITDIVAEAITSRSNQKLEADARAAETGTKYQAHDRPAA